MGEGVSMREKGSINLNAKAGQAPAGLGASQAEYITDITAVTGSTMLGAIKRPVSIISLVS